MPKVYNKHHVVPIDAILVDRSTPWGNPHRMKHDGVGERVRVIKAFVVYAGERHRDDPSWLAPLKGKDLVCWCKPWKCHADILLKLANGEPLP
jgi:hypothetical protein